MNDVRGPLRFSRRDLPERDRPHLSRQSPRTSSEPGYTRFSRGRPEADAPAVEDPVDAPVDTGRRPIGPMAVAFLLAAALPVFFSIGALAMTPARLVMVLAFFPVMFSALSGTMGRWRAADYLILIYVAWSSVAILVYGGLGQIEFVGISAIEFLTPYFLARVAIRNAAQYRTFLRLALFCITSLALLAFVEATTGKQILSELLRPLAPVYPQVPDSYDRRLGMVRAMATFQHPILFGVVMSAFVAPLFYTTRTDGKRGGWLFALPPIAATFFSLSSGAWLCVVAQFGLMAWNRILAAMKARWQLFGALAVAAYIVVDLLSNRTPFEVFISYAAFSSHTGYWRILIFQFGMDNVWANPIFGLGLADWERPAWMHSASVDNFWLLNAMRYGIPGFLSLAAFYISVIASMARSRPRTIPEKLHRNGHVFALVALILSLATVHIWGTALYFILFFIGAGMWMADTEQEKPGA